MVRQAHHVPLVSVIVPTFNEGKATLDHLAPLRDDPAVEVIIVDAKEVGRANRAYQMNRGACQARGEVLVFLHADTKINLQDLWIIHQALKEDQDLVGGAFRFVLDSVSWKARVVEWGVRLREWIFRLPYGDQALFVRRSVFEEIGGYPEVPLLEDVLLVRAIKKRGRLLFYPRPAITSARRWEKQGYLKTTLVNWTTMILWRFGVSLETLASFRHRIFLGGANATCGCSISRNLETEQN